MHNHPATAAVAPYAAPLLRLLQQVLYQDEGDLWRVLVAYRDEVARYVARIGLELVLSVDDGFAYLRQPDLVDEHGHSLVLPRLTRRTQLSRLVTLLAVLLRGRLDEYDLSEFNDGQLVVSEDEVYQLALPHLEQHPDERALRGRVHRAVGTLCELGMLKPVGGDESSRYLVRRVLKAWLDADTLSAIKEQVTHGTVNESE